MCLFRFRFYQPEFAKNRKLFATGFGGINCQSACREAIDLSRSYQAKIRGALKHQELILVFIGVERVMHAESGKANILWRFSRKVSGGAIVVKKVLREFQWRVAAWRCHMKTDRFAIEKPRVKPLDFEQGFTASQRGFRARGNRAILFII